MHCLLCSTRLPFFLSYFRRPLYEVYAVDPWTSSPRFHLAGSLTLDELIKDSNSFSCAHGMFVLHCDRGPVLWDWEKDSWVQIPFNKFVLKVIKFT
jgi:hypothetical protein